MNRYDERETVERLELVKGTSSVRKDAGDEWGEDAALAKALADFRSSVHAWSDSVSNRPRSVMVQHRRSWGRALGWALGCVVGVSAAGGGGFQYEHRKEVARIAAEREAQKRLVEERAREAEELLARVDNDVSQEVPDAMEPLARLMSDDESQSASQSQ